MKTTPKSRLIPIYKWQERMFKKVENLALEELKQSKYIENNLTKPTYLAYYTFLKSLPMRLANDYDCILAVGGERGVGKSSFSLYTAMSLGYLLNQEFDPNENVIYSYNHKDAIEKITKSKGSIYIFDEAIEGMSGRDAITRLGNQLVKILVRVRKRRNVLIVNMPKFSMFGKAYRISLINLRVEMVYRTDEYSVAALLRKDKDPFNSDPWFMEWEARISRYKYQANSVWEAMATIQKHPCFVCLMKIPRLPKRISNEYQEASQRSIEMIEAIEEVGRRKEEDEDIE